MTAPRTIAAAPAVAVAVRALATGAGAVTRFIAVTRAVPGDPTS
ncbi:hypothetical protein [Streptomyces lavendofoliae]|uniref:Uncharacterized protein n=1 Tax=Streptomyces lavendofoliae TaxID=67314 RepID=A0A918HX13_9ACTN|nr:hypothetical protein [Streptomyces lavendofoliae]GGU39664.1 hypothetical protein GCM10010274_29110 [Streptomyces lavendofoliae]